MSGENKRHIADSYQVSTINTLYQDINFKQACFLLPIIITDSSFTTFDNVSFCSYVDSRQQSM